MPVKEAWFEGIKNWAVNKAVDTMGNPAWRQPSGVRTADGKAYVNAQGQRHRTQYTPNTQLNALDNLEKGLLDHIKGQSGSSYSDNTITRYLNNQAHVLEKRYTPAYSRMLKARLLRNPSIRPESVRRIVLSSDPNSIDTPLDRAPLVKDVYSGAVGGYVKDKAMNGTYSIPQSVQMWVHSQGAPKWLSGFLGNPWGLGLLAGGVGLAGLYGVSRMFGGKQQHPQQQYPQQYAAVPGTGLMNRPIHTTAYWRA